MVKKIISSIMALAIMASIGTSVMAGDTKNDGAPKRGTQAEWKQLRQEFESGKRKVNPRSDDALVRAFGSYPRTKGDVLVTDQYFSWQADKSWTGHAGIVRSPDETTEAFPDTSPTVDTHRNNWASRYLGRDIYGLEVDGTTTSQRYAAAEWCAGKKSSALCYNLLGGVGSSTTVNCASLVYHGYKNASGVGIGQGLPTVTPMDLVQSGNTSIIYTSF